MIKLKNRYDALKNLHEVIIYIQQYPMISIICCIYDKNFPHLKSAL